MAEPGRRLDRDRVQALVGVRLRARAETLASPRNDW
jgi:hypothetical protein